MDEPYWQDATKLKKNIPDIVTAYEEDQEDNNDYSLKSTPPETPIIPPPARNLQRQNLPGQLQQSDLEDKDFRKTCQVVLTQATKCYNCDLSPEKFVVKNLLCRIPKGTTGVGSSMRSATVTCDFGGHNFHRSLPLTIVRLLAQGDEEDTRKTE